MEFAGPFALYVERDDDGDVYNNPSSPSSPDRPPVRPSSGPRSYNPNNPSNPNQERERNRPPARREINHNNPNNPNNPGRDRDLGPPPPLISRQNTGIRQNRRDMRDDLSFRDSRASIGPNNPMRPPKGIPTLVERQRNRADNSMRSPSRPGFNRPRGGRGQSGGSNGRVPYGDPHPQSHSEL